MQHVPCGLEGQVLGGHHFGHFGCPACKLITLTLRCFGSGDGAAVSYRSGGIYHVVPLEGQGVIVHIPCGIVGETAYRNGGAFHKFRIPACEGVAFLGGVFGLGDYRAVVERLGGLHAVNVKGHVILDGLEVGHEGKVGDSCKGIGVVG